jgi:hypothetical protein
VSCPRPDCPCRPAVTRADLRRVLAELETLRDKLDGFQRGQIVAAMVWLAEMIPGLPE